MSVDPLADEYPGWSPYNYVLNKPTGNIDPDGEAVCGGLCIGLAIAGALIADAIDPNPANAPSERDVASGNVEQGKSDLEFATEEAAGAGIGHALGKLLNRGVRYVKSFFSSSDEVIEGLAKSGAIDPSRVRFSQDSISPDFKSPEFGSVTELTEKLKSGTLSASDIQPIRVVEKDGKLFTLDNRRLKAFQDAGVEIRFKKLDEIPKDQLFKFTTKNEGTSIQVRQRRR